MVGLGVGGTLCVRLFYYVRIDVLNGQWTFRTAILILNENMWPYLNDFRPGHLFNQHYKITSRHHPNMTYNKNKPMVERHVISNFASQVFDTICRRKGEIAAEKGRYIGFFLKDEIETEQPRNSISRSRFVWSLTRVYFITLSLRSYFAIFSSRWRSVAIYLVGEMVTERDGRNHPPYYIIMESFRLFTFRYEMTTNSTDI